MNSYFDDHISQCRMTDEQKGLFYLGIAVWLTVKDQNDILFKKMSDAKKGMDGKELTDFMNRVFERTLDHETAHSYITKAFGLISPHISKWNLSRNETIFDIQSGWASALMYYKYIEKVGVKEAYEILGWDYAKNRTMINTYLKRGVFPKPIQTLASGPIWTRQQIEDYRDARK